MPPLQMGNCMTVTEGSLHQDPHVISESPVLYFYREAEQDLSRCSCTSGMFFFSIIVSRGLEFAR